MAKLTKQQSKLHTQACKLLQQDKLSYEDKIFVLDHWHESATHMNGVAGAFFTPRSLARDLAIEVTYPHVIDLCAGIGSLAFAAWEHSGHTAKIACVEINPEYVAVGRKILPEATWIHADVFDCALLSEKSRRFDCAISNPPFGNVKTNKNRYGCFEYDLIAAARLLSNDGVFILPQASVPWKYSGGSTFQKVKNGRYETFSKNTGIALSMNCGIDTSYADTEWSIKVPRLEIALGYGEEA